MYARDGFMRTPISFDANDQKIATLLWGFTLGFGILTAIKIFEQSMRISRRIGISKSGYLWMVWILYIDNFIASVIMWLFINGHIKARSDTVLQVQNLRPMC
jgi:hypothetical protein